MEEKLQFLFSKFQSELSGTIETIPGSLLESCVQSFKENLNVSILEIFKEEFMPALLDQILTQVRESAKEKPSLSSNELKQIKKHIDEKVESVKDLILVNEAQYHTNMDNMSKSLSNIEDKLCQKLSSLENQLSDLQTNDHNRFEYVKRRLGDIASMAHNTHSMLESLVKPVNRDCPPHPSYNNPLLNIQHEEPIHLRNNGNHSQFNPQRPYPERNHTPSLDPPKPANDEFPYIDHGPVDPEMRKELWKGIPKNGDWEKFSGELPYNHELWIKNTDILVRDYLMLDSMIISRLTILLTDTARNWYLGIRDKHGNKSWAWWKNAIRNKFGTDNWKWKMQQEFESDHFTYDGRKVHKWF